MVLKEPHCFDPQPQARQNIHGVGKSPCSYRTCQPKLCFFGFSSQHNLFVAAEFFCRTAWPHLPHFSSFPFFLSSATSRSNSFVLFFFTLPSLPGKYAGRFWGLALAHFMCHPVPFTFKVHVWCVGNPSFPKTCCSGGHSNLVFVLCMEGYPCVHTEAQVQTCFPKVR